MSIQNAREIALPLAMVIGLIVNVLVVGISWGRLGAQLQALQEQTSEAKKMVSMLQYELTEVKIKLAAGGDACLSRQ